MRSSYRRSFGAVVFPRVVPFARALMWTTWVITYPIAKLLDCCLEPGMDRFEVKGGFSNL